MVENWNQYKDLEYYPDRFCACGCGSRIKVKPYHKKYGIPKYISGHNSKVEGSSRGGRKRVPIETRLCACGCGETFTCRVNSRRRYISGHNMVKGKNKLPRIKKICPGCGIEFPTPTGSQERKFHTKECYWEYQKELWKNLDFVKSWTALWNCRPNKSEKFLIRFLQRLFPNEWKYVGDASFWLRIDEQLLNPDFINVNGQKKIIELFGDYWHGEERTGISNEQHERERVNLLAQYGYQTLIIWEHELADENKLEERLLQFN